MNMEISNQLVTDLCFASGHPFRTWSEGDSKALGAWEAVKGATRFPFGKLPKAALDSWILPTC